MGKKKHRQEKRNQHQGAQKSSADPSFPEEARNPESKTNHASQTQKKLRQEGGQRVGIKERIKTSSTTDWLLTLLTAILAFFAIRQFWVTYGQLDVMRKDERAWLTVKTTTANVAPTGDHAAANDLPSAKLTFTNTGKSPAMARQKIGASPGSYEPDPLSNDEAQSLENGTAWLAIHGFLKYEDIFQGPHWVRFCIWRGYGKAIGRPVMSRGCTEYNSVDQN